jgi:hypothetical protein
LTTFDDKETTSCNQGLLSPWGKGTSTQMLSCSKALDAIANENCEVRICINLCNCSIPCRSFPSWANVSSHVHDCSSRVCPVTFMTALNVKNADDLRVQSCTRIGKDAREPLGPGPQTPVVRLIPRSSIVQMSRCPHMEISLSPDVHAWKSCHSPIC